MTAAIALAFFVGFNAACWVLVRRDRRRISQRTNGTERL